MNSGDDPNPARSLARGARALGLLGWVLAVACALCATWVLASLAWLIAKRVAFPFELEWMEGAMVDHVARVVSGKGIYVAPSIEFIPYLYNPLFYWVSAGVARLTGVGFLPLRLVSVTATAVALGLIFELVRRETGKRLPSFLGAGLYASTYAITGTWFDAGRVDSLAIALCLATVFVASNAESKRGYLATAALAALAFGARQNAIPLVPALWLCFTRRRGQVAALWFLLPALAFIVAGILLLNHVTGGWYWFYAFKLPLSHSLHPEALLDPSNLPMIVAAGFAIYFLASCWRRDRARAEFFTLAAAALVTMGVAGRIHSGSYVNDYIPIFAAASFMYGLGLAELTSTPRFRPDLVRVLAFGASLLQFQALVFDPRRYAPSERDLEEGKRLLAEISSHAGEVLVPEHGYVTAMAGKTSFAHEMALIDLVRSPADSQGLVIALYRDYRAALARQRFAAIILDTPWPFQGTAMNYYHVATHFPFHGHPIFFSRADVQGLRFVLEPNSLASPSSQPEQ